MGRPIKKKHNHNICDCDNCTAIYYRNPEKARALQKIKWKGGLGMSQKTIIKNGTPLLPHSFLPLVLDNPVDYAIAEREAIVEESDKPKCSCTLQDLMSGGCKCGGK